MKKSVVALTVFLFFLLAQSPATADTILFSDLTDNVSVSTTSTRVGGLSFGVTSLFESCVFTLLPPGFPAATLISGAPVTIFIAESPGPSSVSDEISISGPALPPGIGLGINFFSDVDTNPGSLGQCFTPPIVVACGIVENGAIQTAAQLFWSDGTIDAIQFQSGIPEPPSWMLLLLAFLALGVVGNHRTLPIFGFGLTIPQVVLYREDKKIK